MSEELLSEQTVAAYLRGRGLLDSGPASVRELSGGVSSVVLAVQQNDRRMIVKQSLERLRVAREWHAPRTRILAESAALMVTGRIVPSVVPPVVDEDPDRLALVMGEAPEGWTDWKCRLMSGNVDIYLARSLGRAVASVHRTTEAVPLPAAIEGQGDMFRQLRLEPYHHEVASRLPHLRSAVERVISSLEVRRCLVHGDLSPKNILTSGNGDFWLIDFEVAHRGNPMFDIAFLLSHLLLKAVHLPGSAPQLAEAGRVFVAEYTAEWPDGAPGEELSAQVGCLVLARVFGKSPVEYLTADEQSAAVAVGEHLLSRESHVVRDYFDLVRVP
ncbi:phosphotransferase family protein [Microbacterium sp.]|uniref:phosphotransferase family protein n=1 Tax=Microbacterium sp. TaxID=51671 RepID=UPI003F6FF51A